MRIAADVRGLAAGTGFILDARHPLVKPVSTHPWRVLTGYGDELGGSQDRIAGSYAGNKRGLAQCLTGAGIKAGMRFNCPSRAWR